MNKCFVYFLIFKHALDILKHFLPLAVLLCLVPVSCPLWAFQSVPAPACQCPQDMYLACRLWEDWCNFVPSWDDVKSVRKPCRFITSSFILQEKAHSDDKILLSILSVLAGEVFPDGMTAMTGMTGILGCPAAVIPYGRTPYKHKCRHGVSLPFFGS